VQFDQVASSSGFVFRVQRKSGPVWYAKYRLPDGRQVKKKIGPAWAGRGRPAPGFYTERTANDWLDDTLAGVRERHLAGPVPDRDVHFAEAAREWLRYCEHDRACKPSTMQSYRSSVEGRLIPRFGDMQIGDITALHIERWRAALPVSPRMKNKLLTELHGIFKRAMKMYGVPRNPAAEVEHLRVPKQCDLEVFSPEEVMALVRAAADAQDAAIYLTAAFTGLRRGELIALCWRDVDFAGSLIRVRASYAAHTLTTPKSGKIRAVPMAPQVASALASLGQRPDHVSDVEVAALVAGKDQVLGLGAASPVRQGARACRAATPTLPRPSPHVRYAGHCQGRHRARAGVDGPRGHPDHAQVSALRAPC
jgi:integrase